MQIRLLTRCKILDVVSFLHCLQIILSLKSPIPTLYNVKDVIWISTVNRFVDYKFIKFIKFINYKFTVLTGAALLALAKSIY